MVIQNFKFETWRDHKVFLKLINCKDFMPFGTDPFTEQAKHLLCHSPNEVYIIDTSSYEITEILDVGSEVTIKAVCTNVLEDTLVIGVWTDDKQIRFLRYKAPDHSIPG